MAIKGAIFDMDGTLLDSMYVWIDIGARFLAEKGFTASDEDKKILNTMLLKGQSEYFREHFGFTQSVDEIIEEINKFVERYYFDEVLVKPGIPELLETLKDRNVKMCVATASDRYLVEAALERNGILKYFDRIFTCNEFDCDKSIPLIFDTALEFLGTEKSETYVFEDTLTSVKTVKAAGYPLVAIRDKWSEKNKKIISELADFYVDTPEYINVDLL